MVVCVVVVVVVYATSPELNVDRDDSDSLEAGSAKHAPVCSSYGGGEGCEGEAVSLWVGRSGSSNVTLLAFIERDGTLLLALLVLLPPCRWLDLTSADRCGRSSDDNLAIPLGKGGGGDVVVDPRGVIDGADAEARLTPDIDPILRGVCDPCSASSAISWAMLGVD